MNLGTTHVLKRELVDVPAAVRAAPAPCVPTFADPFALRLVDPDTDDPELIASWMSRPHLAETWEQPWSAAQYRIDSQARLAGTYSRPCILSYDGNEVAYVELYRAAKDECGAIYNSDPWDMGFHIATADTTLLGKGIVSEWMAVLAERIWALEPLCTRIVVDPDYRNMPMRKALTKRGYEDLGEFDVRPDRRIALFAKSRPLRGS